MSTPRTLLSTLACLLSLALPVAWAADPLDDARARMKIEAERIEKEFADGRSAAYKLVRNANPQLVEAIEKLQTLLALVQNDTSLEPRRREVLIVTLKFDLQNVRTIAGERRQASLTRDNPLPRLAREENKRYDDARRFESSKRLSDDARSVIESRSRSLADARGDRLRYNDRYNKVMRSVDDSALPEGGDIRYPKNWKELSMRRSPGQKMTEKEKAIMSALTTVIGADFNKATFEEVVDYFRKSLKIDIVVDKRGMEEAGVTYDGSQVTLKLRGTARTVLKRILADLNLAYVIKDEAILITSRERAGAMTTARVYYIGDLVGLVDYNLPPFLSQLAVLENANRILTMITQTIDPQSWRVNNPDAVGEIVFDPLRMALVVKQTAEVHLMMGGGSAYR